MIPFLPAYRSGHSGFRGDEIQLPALPHCSRVEGGLRPAASQFNTSGPWMRSLLYIEGVVVLESKPEFVGSMLPSTSGHNFLLCSY